MELKDWLQQNNIKYKELKSNIYSIADKTFVEIPYIEGELVINDRFELILQEGTPTIQCDYYIFKFGGIYYYCENPFEPKFNILKYVGEYDGQVQSDYSEFPFLGVHGKYELTNGSRSYEDWIQKAKFLGIRTIGLCEKNTLAGSLAFQKICEKKSIDCIQGATISVEEIGEIKLYVHNLDGWQNLLIILYKLNQNGKYIELNALLNHLNGLILVFSCSYEINPSIVRKIAKKTKCYYQIDTVEWKSNEKDKQHLLNLKKYIRKYYDLIPPILICDAYYLDKEEHHIKTKLNKIGKVGFQNQSEDQYFKSLDDVFYQLSEIFNEKDDTLLTLFDESVSNAIKIGNQCKEFKIPIKNSYLPNYPLKESELHFETSENLFWYLIEKGLEEKVIAKGKDISIYIDRIETEVALIKKGGFIDYFLITWDILNFCKENDILTGIARGSAGGCAVAYILGIVQIDPIQYGLLFERFLNEGRMGIVEKKYTDFEESTEIDTCFEVELDNGEKINLSSNSKVFVRRGDLELEVSVVDLKENDEVIK